MAEATGLAVVLTALPLEHRAVRALLTERSLRTHPSGTVFEQGTLPGTPWQVAVACIDAGNLGSAVIAERARAWLRPEALFFVGVAGGLKDDIRLGDVVVATRVYHLHGGKETSAGHRLRPVPGAVSHRLGQAAYAALVDDRWRLRIPPALRTSLAPEVHHKPVAAGEVVLNSRTTPLYTQIIAEHYEDAAAVEMESAGIAKAAGLTDGLHILTVRGISDHADGAKAAADATGSQPRAAAHAAAALAEILAVLVPTARPSDPAAYPPPAADAAPPAGAAAPREAAAAPRIPAPAPRVDGSAPRVGGPAPRVDGPASRVDVSAPRVDGPALRDAAPAPRVHAPAPRRAAPAPHPAAAGPPAVSGAPSAAAQAPFAAAVPAAEPAAVPPPPPPVVRVPQAGPADGTAGELATTLGAFPDMASLEFRQGILADMGEILGLGRPFLAAERAVAHDHQREIARRVRAYRDPDAALQALYAALADARPDDAALDRLRRLLG
ncbi:5'-methylthioadenosine/S-adenosylhomocysteine nucleosidase [Streptomyces sp. LX-29]|uniref:5'-methylthioadenosine/S-adenosylhomocysteine nucleosidase n=1 Tax=Streptomyces sp. LX-29 TaxID=2900152 RepID=UPI00240D6DA6|nr:5'-methylthioadenosine/S-adenosylhomocysteine nucleosidase [Streptomyces sp. LX-29]WFB08183.1 5'-methylthioadenosine/S-adenosylhomocysteine nucleosidase [Streptomyces sp. LX-29]